MVTAINLLTGFLLAAGTMWLVLPALRRMKLRQHAYEDAPQTHQVKTGTPTMGGVVFVVALVPLLAPLLFLLAGQAVPPAALASVALFVLVAACAAIGFADDYTAIRRGKNAGLRARTKYLLTALAAALFLVYTGPLLPFENRDAIFNAGLYVLHAPHWAWIVLGVLAVSGTIHAVNLTDGLDGLAAGSMIPPLLALAAANFIVATRSLAGNYHVGLALASLLSVGACVGFLVFNRHPARVFMGDTGSLALGALLSGIAILSGEMLLLVVIGAVFVAEALSVIMQVTYFKSTGGKRIFKMSPLHHHFELCGWPETKVTSRFWIASAACSAAGVALVAIAGAPHVR